MAGVRLPRTLCSPHSARDPLSSHPLSWTFHTVIYLLLTPDLYFSPPRVVCPLHKGIFSGRARPPPRQAALLPADVYAAQSFARWCIQEPGRLSPLLPPIYCSRSSHSGPVVLSSKHDRRVSSPLCGYCLGLGAFKCPGSHNNLFFGGSASGHGIFLQP